MGWCCVFHVNAEMENNIYTHTITKTAQVTHPLHRCWRSGTCPKWSACWCGTNCDCKQKCTKYFIHTENIVSKNKGLFFCNFLRRYHHAWFYFILLKKKVTWDFSYICSFALRCCSPLFSNQLRPLRAQKS